MSRGILAATALVAAALMSVAAHASDFQPALESFYGETLAGLATDASLVAAITARNAETAGLDQAGIDALDTAWRAEVGAAETPTITPVIASATSDFLRGLVEQSGGRITEIFVMDALGLNVASSSTTSDMWQGDEEKFTETFGKGAGVVHYSEVELDESTGRYQAQISVTVSDPATGQPIGAVTVGVDAEALM